MPAYGVSREDRSVCNEARRRMFAVLDDIAKIMPSRSWAWTSGNGSEFINDHLLDWYEKREIAFTRSRPGNSDDGYHVEQMNWAIVRTVVDYHRYDTDKELLVLNMIWVSQSQMANYFCPQSTQ
ncbi:MAG: hypothetical protein WAX14_08500 [Rhodococcus sp. (in: high G+C Gram-positive bacteria)]|uniref:hypothetical protein n=1 Tax=Rhodococcus sp. TaxID=1831 RepID=UPI003BB5A019